MTLTTTLALDNMTLDDQGFAFVSDDDIVELLLEHKKVKILPGNIKSWQQFENNCRLNGIDNPFSVAEDNLDWNLPEPYKSLDIERHLIELCSADQEYDRVAHELSLFRDRDLYDLLRFLVYFMDTIRSNNIVYGVGRGSSVASYCLYLIGVHRVNSLKYNLDIKEFLK